MTETLADAIEIAIGAENANEKLFRGLEAKFAAYPELAAFWHQYALDEVGHAHWLEKLRTRLTPERLAATVDDGQVIAMLQSISEFSVENALKNVKNLEDAYQLVTDVENGETNAIFRFLLDHIETDDTLRIFVRNQLSKHVAKIATELPAQYTGSMARRVVLAGF
jgi:hypothetical protein